MLEPEKFTKIPVTIEAIKFKAGPDGNLLDVQRFVGVIPDHDDNTLGFRMAKRIFGSDESEEVVARVWDKLHSTWVGVKHGQWIIKGVKGEFYPCDDDVFMTTYVKKMEEDLSFSAELSRLLNRHSAENYSGTPDFILANFLENVLVDWNHAISARAKWRGESLELPALQELRAESPENPTKH